MESIGQVGKSGVLPPLVQCFCDIFHQNFKFALYRFCTYCVTFTPKYFILGDTNVNATVSNFIFHLFIASIYESNGLLHI